MFKVSVTDKFASAHFLVGYKGKCRNIHGHNYYVQVTLKSKEVDKQGMLVDFKLLKKSLKEVTEKLDHALIIYKCKKTEKVYNFFKENNFKIYELPDNPTAENIAKHIYKIMNGKFPNQIKCVRVWETKTSSAIYQEKEEGGD